MFEILLVLVAVWAIWPLLDDDWWDDPGSF
jgi:hypothetical protein